MTLCSHYIEPTLELRWYQAYTKMPLVRVSLSYTCSVPIGTPWCLIYPGYQQVRNNDCEPAKTLVQ